MKPLAEVTRDAFTRATPENVGLVFQARIALMGVVVLVFSMSFLIVLLLYGWPS